MSRDSGSTVICHLEEFISNTLANVPTVAWQLGFWAVKLLGYTPKRHGLCPTGTKRCCRTLLNLALFVIPLHWSFFKECFGGIYSRWKDTACTLQAIIHQDYWWQIIYSMQSHIRLEFFCFVFIHLCVYT